MTTTAFRPVVAGMRTMLFVASGPMFFFGLPLSLLPGQTERFFAWTINAPLTAAFLGGAYWASGLLAWLAARERHWAAARMAVPAILACTGLTLLVTLRHLNRFHLARDLDFATQFVTWTWIVAYAAVPPLLLSEWRRQRRCAGGDPPVSIPQPTWARAIFAGLGTILIMLGVLLLIAPLSVAGAWPWQLTALTGRAIGAWGVGFGIAVARTAWEGDWRRARASCAALIAFGLLELLALARYNGEVFWARPLTWAFIACLLALLGMGTLGVVRARRAA